MTTELGTRIKALIHRDGPMSIASYMSLCLGDPEHGYYMRRDPLGLAGDFVTAPEVSQMFGELIGAWCLAVWHQIGAPSPVHLVELGPGRGTLMADLLRMAAIRPTFLEAARLHLVETSPVLRERQGEALDGGPLAPTWHDTFDTVPQGPAIVLANEFFDALPIHQFVRTDSAWRERVVGVNDEDRLAFGLGVAILPDDVLPANCAGAPVGAVIEISPVSTAIMATIAGRITATGGAMLAIDYGHEATAPGDTFQAVRAHHYADPLEAPGTADLTAHADFAALAEAATKAGATAHPLLTQGDFLLRLGLLERAGHLGRDREPTIQDDIRAAVHRLAGPEEMGNLFKVLAVTQPGVTPEPFDS